MPDSKPIDMLEIDLKNGKHWLDIWVDEQKKKRAAALADKQDSIRKKYREKYLAEQQARRSGASNSSES